VTAIANEADVPLAVNVVPDAIDTVFENTVTLVPVICEFPVPTNDTAPPNVVVADVEKTPVPAVVIEFAIVEDVPEH